jgi:hypothetical protein
MIWIGIPMLVLLLHICWQLAMFERRRAIDWLRVGIPPVPEEAPASIFKWSSLTARLSNRMTWKTLAYLLLKFPLGSCFFLITVVSLALSLIITIVCLLLAGITTPFFLLTGALQHVSEPGQRPRRYFLFALTGFGLDIIAFRLLNGLAFLEGQLARSLLGPSETELRL